MITIIPILFMVGVHVWTSTGKFWCPLHHTHTHPQLCRPDRPLTASGCPPQSPSLLLYLSPYSSILKKWLWVLELLHSTLQARPISPVLFSLCLWSMQLMMLCGWYEEGVSCLTRLELLNETESLPIRQLDFWVNLKRNYGLSVHKLHYAITKINIF